MAYARRSEGGMPAAKNPYVLAFAALYAVAIGVLVRSGVYSLAEPLFMLAIFGILLPGLAWRLCRGIRPFDVRAPGARPEIVATFALVGLVTLYLVWGSDWIDALVYSRIEETPRVDFFLTIGKKVLVFVAIPYAALSLLFGYRWRDFGFVTDFRRAFGPPFVRLMAVFFVVFFAIQFFVGQAAQPVFRGEFPAPAVISGGLLLYISLLIEVGLVEEFFFRAVLQTRLAAWLNSEAAGVVMMALIFGLAHAPGLYLREAGAVTSLGSTPDLLSVVAYSVAVLSMAALTFGVIWAKTRNILVLIALHAWVDTLPGLPAFIETFSPGL